MKPQNPITRKFCRDFWHNLGKSQTKTSNQKYPTVVASTVLSAKALHSKWKLVITYRLMKLFYIGGNALT